MERIFSLKTKFLVLLTCLVTLSFAALAQTPNSSEEAQTFRTVNPQDLKVLPQSMAAEALGVHITSGDAINAVHAASTTLPLCSMTDNGATFDVVGACPNVTGTTNIPITIVPVVLKITQGGKTFVFSPNATDPGCLGGTNTALSLFQQSPFFSSVPLSFNGVSEGTTQYLDGLQNSAFATTVAAGHHTIFSPVTVGATLTVSVNAGTNGNTTAEVFSVGGTQCGTNTGTTNPAAKLAVININTLASHLSNANPGAFVFFEMYNSVMSAGAANNLNNCCILGFHNATGSAVNAPGATFGIGDFQGGNQTVFTGVADVSVISHEVAEWANDPSGNNPVPGTWGNIGQVSGCQ